MSTSREPKNPAAEFISVNDKLIVDLIDMRVKIDELRKVIGKTESDVFYDSIYKMIETAEKLKKEFPNGLGDAVKQATENGPYEIDAVRFAAYLSLYQSIYNISLEIGKNPQIEATLNKDIAEAKAKKQGASYDNTLTQNLLKPVKNLALFKDMLANIQRMKGQTEASQQGFENAAEAVNNLLASQQTKKTITVTHEAIHDILNNMEDQIKKLPNSSSSKKFYSKQLSSLRNSLSEYNYDKIAYQLSEIYSRADESLDKRKGLGFYRKGTTSLQQNIRDLSFSLSQGISENKNNRTALEAAKPQLFLKEAKKLQDTALGAEQQYNNKRRNANSNPASQETLKQSADNAKKKYHSFLASSPLSFDLREALRDNKQDMVGKIIKDYWPMFANQDYINSFMTNVDKSLTDAQRFNLTRALMAEYVAATDSKTTGLLRVADHLSTRLYNTLMNNLGFEPMNANKPVPPEFNALNRYIYQSISNEEGNKNSTIKEKQKAAIAPILLMANSNAIQAAGTDAKKRKDTIASMDAARNDPNVLANLMNPSVLQAAPQTVQAAEDPTITTPDFTDTESLDTHSEITDTAEFDTPEESTEEEIEEEWDLDALNTALKDADKKMESEDLQAFLQGHGDSPTDTEPDEFAMDSTDFADKLAAALKANQPAPETKNAKGRELKDAVYQDEHNEKRPAQSARDSAKSRGEMAERYKKIEAKKAANDQKFKAHANDASYKEKSGTSEPSDDNNQNVTKRKP